MQRGLVYRNVGLNLLGQVFTVAIGVLAIPMVIRGLGRERFGVLALAWGAVGALSLFDLGLGKATTKFVAQFLGEEQPNRVPSLVWTSALLKAVLGFMECGLLLLFTPLLVQRILHLSPSLVPEARATFYLLGGIALPIQVGSAWQSALEAYQRYDLVNAVRVPTSLSNFLVPAAGVELGLNLPGIMLLLVVTRICAAGAYLWLWRRSLPYVGSPMEANRTSAKLLLGYGTWVAVSNGLWPCFMYLDRFLIGALLSVGAVAFYAAPFEMVTRLWAIPISFVPLFPAFSTLGRSRGTEVGDLYARTNKYLLLILGPVTILIVVLAGPLLKVWLGAIFQARSTTVLQILALGVLAVSFASLADSLAKGLNRPDITAKLQLAELPLYALLSWLLIRHLGIVGAAAAWTARALADLALMVYACRKLLAPNARIPGASGLLYAGASLLFLGGAVALMAFTVRGTASVIGAVALLLGFGVISWRYLLDASDHSQLRAALGLQSEP